VPAAVARRASTGGKAPGGKSTGMGKGQAGKGSKVKEQQQPPQRKRPVSPYHAWPAGKAAATAAKAAARRLTTRAKGASLTETELAHSRTRRLRLLYKELAELDEVH
jgi:hypothetical protein